jgi:hypothetical protein
LVNRYQTTRHHVPEDGLSKTLYGEYDISRTVQLQLLDNPTLSAETLLGPANKPKNRTACVWITCFTGVSEKLPYEHGASDPSFVIANVNKTIKLRRAHLTGAFGRRSYELNYYGCDELFSDNKQMLNSHATVHRYAH